MQIGASSLEKKKKEKKRQIWKDLQLLAGIGLSRNVQGIIVHPETSPGPGWEWFLLPGKV